MDYSKWDHIEISDDEDDTHPNVDTASLFKWRHEARVEREREQQEAKSKRQAESQARTTRIQTLKERLAGAQMDGSEGSDAQFKGMMTELKELEQQQTDFEAKEAELERYEREHPTWNVDNISQDRESRTIINTAKKIPEPELTEEGRMKALQEFIQKHHEEAKQFGMLSKSSDSLSFLQNHTDIVCEHLSSFLCVWCVDLKVESKLALLERVARQAICVQYILELAKTFERDPRACVSAFYARHEKADETYHANFELEIKAFLERVEGRYQARLKEARKRAQEERKAKLKPGQLDPMEVLESLPEKLQRAFEAQDVALLQQGFEELAEQNPEDFRHHYDRMVKSGLWVPVKRAEGASAQEQPSNEAAQGDDNESPAADQEAASWGYCVVS